MTPIKPLYVRTLDGDTALSREGHHVCRLFGFSIVFFAQSDWSERYWEASNTDKPYLLALGRPGLAIPDKLDPEALDILLAAKALGTPPDAWIKLAISLGCLGTSIAV